MRLQFWFGPLLALLSPCLILATLQDSCGVSREGGEECQAKFGKRKVESRGVELLQRLHVRHSSLEPATGTWTYRASTNCDDHHGARPIKGAAPVPGLLSLEECQAKCEEHSLCRAIVMNSDVASPCWLLQEVEPGRCESAQGFHTWELQSSTPQLSDGAEPTIEAVCSGSSGMIQFAKPSDKCLDVKDGSTASGTRIQLWWCGNSGSTWPNQQFIVPSPGTSGMIRWTPQPRKCLEVAGGTNRDGTLLQLGDCDASKSSMQFTMPTQSTGAIRWSAFPDKCIDVDNGNLKDGTKIQIWSCASQAPYRSNQLFTTCATGVSPKPATTPAPVPMPLPAPVPGSTIGWSWQGTAGSGWCQGQKPVPGWELKSTCPATRDLQVRALTYNLFWWNLFGQRGGNGGSAGKNIAQAHSIEPFDVMGFQECEDVKRVLRDAGLSDEYDTMDGGHAISMAWRKSQWKLLASGAEDVNEDQRAQYYGRRAAEWARLQHLQTGKTLFFVNHHGPLPVNSGGACTGASTAYNILRIMGNNAVRGDLILLTGDFNQAPGSETISTLEGYMNRAFTGSSFGGVDNFFSNCGGNAVVSTQNLGGAESDHDAITITFQI